jgi:YegS/Rv2252/BmrU family lipid kinase
MSDRPFIVVNPAAANGRVGRKWDDYRALLEDELGEFEFAHSKSPDDAIEVTRRALRDGFTNIGSLGGDGTHHLVTNGFYENGSRLSEVASLSVLPVGTGGDFRRSLRVGGKDLRRYARVMASGEAVPVDIGHIRFVSHAGEPAERYFINIASWGMGGLVDRVVNQSSKALGGRMSFFLAVIRAVFRYKPAQVELKVDGEPVASERIFNIAACNGQYFGGGMQVGPNAELDDHLFDVIVMPFRGRFSNLVRGTRIYKGTHIELPEVLSFRGEVIEAESDIDCLLDIDGEAPGRLPATIRVIPDGIFLKGLVAEEDDERAEGQEEELEADQADEESDEGEAVERRDDEEGESEPSR